MTPKKKKKTEREGGLDCGDALGGENTWWGHDGAMAASIIVVASTTHSRQRYIYVNKCQKQLFL
jgi:hypothetical protein